MDSHHWQEILKNFESQRKSIEILAKIVDGLHQRMVFLEEMQQVQKITEAANLSDQIVKG